MVAATPPPSLAARLAAALPTGSAFRVHHVCAPPASCTALFSAPPNEEPEATECEPHFLSISISHDGKPVQVFADGVLVYTPATLPTVFVSNADSTGYLHLAQLPKTSGASPVKAVVSAFLEHFVESKRRGDARLVLSLFARAQDQYLFPGSVENSAKHVLDDRGLIKWWCRIFDAILAKYPSAAPSAPSFSSASASTTAPAANTLPLGRGYLVVPGTEAHETKTFFPRPYLPSRWQPSDPLRLLGKSLTLPERCLIPRFPDDPKARFALDLDDELPENGPQPMNSPAKNPHPGKWRSVRSLAQFWELMAFRQECAAGRLVGFLWAVFESEGLRERPGETVLEEEGEGVGVNGAGGAGAEAALPTPDTSQVSLAAVPVLAPTQHQPDSQPEAPLSPLPSQLPLPASPTPTPLPPSFSSDNTNQPPPTPTKPHRAPSPVPTEPGALQLAPPAYTRVIDRLMELDYDTLEAATDSGEKFVEKVLEEANEGREEKISVFGFDVTGTRPLVAEEKVEGKVNGAGGDGVVVLDMGLIRKKKRPAVDEGAETKATEGVNVLSAGLVRKKPKV